MKKQLLLVSTVALIGGALTFSGCKKDDVEAPVITLKGASSVNVTLNGIYVDEGATADDNEDGDVSALITVTNPVDEDLAGTYTVTYSATDAAGNTGTATRTVIVANSSQNLAGSYSVTDISPYPAGTPYTYTETVTASSTINDRLIVTKFGFYTNGGVYFDVTGSTLTVPSQNVNCGNPSALRNFTGTGTIGTGSPTVITIDYTELTGGTSVNARGTYTKQ